jgi:SAM-dependent methyltransferase
MMKGNSDSKGSIMRDRVADFTGSIPAFYDHGLGPVFFADFADDIARRVAASAPKRVLEIAAGTGIVTRRLRDRLPREARLIATDLNPPMLQVARGKFRPDETVDFQPADATSLPFEDASFDAVVGRRRGESIVRTPRKRGCISPPGRQSASPPAHLSYASLRIR